MCYTKHNCAFYYSKIERQTHFPQKACKLRKLNPLILTEREETKSRYFPPNKTLQKTSLESSCLQTFFAEEVFILSLLVYVCWWHFKHLCTTESVRLWNFFKIICLLTIQIVYWFLNEYLMTWLGVSTCGTTLPNVLFTLIQTTHLT